MIINNLNLLEWFRKDMGRACLPMSVKRTAIRKWRELCQSGVILSVPSACAAAPAAVRSLEPSDPSGAGQ